MTLRKPLFSSASWPATTLLGVVAAVSVLALHAFGLDAWGAAALLLGVPVLAFAGAVAHHRRSPTGIPVLSPDGSAQAESPAECGPELRLAGCGKHWRLLLGDVTLMHLEPVSDRDLPAHRSPVTGALAQLLRTTLESSVVAEFVASHRFVLVRVPAAMRVGGQWMRTADGCMKAAVVNGRNGRIAAIGDVLTAGLARGQLVGSAAALAPVLAAGALAAQWQWCVETALQRIERSVDELLRLADRRDEAVLDTARHLLIELDRWPSGDPPVLWPQRLAHHLVLVEQVVRQCRAGVGELVEASLRPGEAPTLAGLDAQQRRQLETLVARYSDASVLLAQLRLAGVAVSLTADDLADAAERFDHVAREFTGDVLDLAASLDRLAHAAVPSRLRPHRRARAQVDLTVSRSLSAGLRDVASRVEPAEHTLVLSASADQRMSIEIAGPPPPST